MLTRTVLAGIVIPVFIAIGSATANSSAGGVECSPLEPTCTVVVEKSGRPGGSAPSGPGTSVGGNGGCVTQRGTAIPCWDDQFGWFSSSDSCYYKHADPQPPDHEEIWQGHYPDGAIYVVTCAEPLGGPGTNGGWVWLPGPPEGYGGDPGQLAQKAVEQMALQGPAIRTPLDGEEIGTVGIPLWLWTEQGATTWGPSTVTASVPGLSVTATAQGKWIDWDLGDGSSMRCEGPGTPYIPGQVESPTCDHVYTVSSAGQPGDVYTVRGTTTWEVTWSGGGMSGVLQVTRSASATVPIGELQVLATY